MVTAVLALLASAPSPATADEVRDQQWQLGVLRMDKAWKHSTGAGQVVAVIDSGVDAKHPDLRGQVLRGADFSDGSTDGRTDPVGHGTTVASLIAGNADGRGVVGVAPDAKILPIRVLDEQNEYDSGDQIAQAVRWAVDHGADVINLSLGSSQTSTRLSAALRYAMNHDVVVVACTGNLANDEGTQMWHPAREPGVVAVAGVTKRTEAWSGSLVGEQTALSAPATDIVGAHAGGTYWRVQGTSFAAPMVSGAAALVRAKFPELNAANVIQRLVTTSWDLGPAGRDSRFGYGLVNPTRALTAEVPRVSSNPLLASGKSRAGGEVLRAEQDAEPRTPGKPGPIDTRRPRAGITTPEFVLLGIATLVVVGAFVRIVGVAISRRSHSEQNSLSKSP